MSRPSPIEEARSRHSLAEVIARTGCGYFLSSGSVTVRCPLPSHGHPDRTPSMRLHLADGIFYCFGCEARGDVVEWVSQAEGVDWRRAIEILDSGRQLANAWAGAEVATAPRAIPTAAPAAAGQSEMPVLTRTPAERVFEALAAAWSYYSYPPLHEGGLAYVRGRGIDAAVLESHTGRAQVGHTPARPDGLVAALQAKGFTGDELVDAGLAHRRAASAPASDFYRQRVLIPIRDEQGRVCGFIGRNVGDQARFAKYKNPPRTCAYDKSVNLYQPLPAPSDGRGQVVVVEGTLDAMAIAVAAIRTGRTASFCPLTQSGRELSERQLTWVLAAHPAPPVLAFDGDAAGRDSAFRYSLAAARLGKAVAVSVLPDEHDPASWLAECGDAGLSAWVRDCGQEGDRQVPAPVAAAAFAIGYARQATGRRAFAATQARSDQVLVTEVIGL